MIKYKPEISEIVVARYNRKPDEKQFERALWEAKKAEEIGCDFPKRNAALRETPEGWEIFVKRA